MEDLTYFDYLFLISFMPILVQFDPQTVVVIDEQSMVVLSRLFFFYETTRLSSKVREMKVKRSRHQYFNFRRHPAEKITAQRPWSGLL